jgi:hypothetical protein
MARGRRRSAGPRWSEEPAGNTSTAVRSSPSINDHKAPIKTTGWAGFADDQARAEWLASPTWTEGGKR